MQNKEFTLFSDKLVGTQDKESLASVVSTALTERQVPIGGDKNLSPSTEGIGKSDLK